MRVTKKNDIKKILVIALSNIGDVILNFPVIDVLKKEFPDARISVLLGPKGEPLFKGNPHIVKLYVFNKYQSILGHIKLTGLLRRERFDLVVDLRNTVFPYLIGARFTTGPFVSKSNYEHLKIQHLNRLKTVVDFAGESSARYALTLDRTDEEVIARILKEKIGNGPYVVLAPGSANEHKRWNHEGYTEVAKRLVDKYKVKVVFVGNEAERIIVEEISRKMPGILNLCGQINLTQLAGLLKNAALVVCNDSGPMHLASYVDVPVVALFGPTDPRTAAPWGTKGAFVKKIVDCPRCRNLKSREAHTCLSAITPDDVWEAIQKIERAHGTLCRNTKIS